MRGTVDPKRPLVWSREAVSDLAEIWTYYAEAAKSETADNIVRNIDRVCRLLDDHPLAGRARDELRPGIRSIAARPHVVFYRITETATEIVRVLDGRRDLDDIFAAEPGA